MSDEKARMGHWDAFEGQTRLKHYILRAYLDRWSRVLIQAGNSRLVFVDAFAGRGRDRKKNIGSPLIAREIAETIRIDFPGSQVDIIAIEANHDNCEELRRNLAEVNAGVVLLEGTLADHIETVLGFVRGDPGLFFLDPWGVKGLSADIVKRLLDGDRREVLLLFDDDGAARVHASATAKPKPKVAGASNFSLFDEAPMPLALTRTQSEESRARSAKATADLVRQVFGPRFLSVEQRIRGQEGIKRRESLLAEYVELLKDLKATHVLPFSIIDGENRHHYYLIHASRHKKAFTVMKEAIHRALRQRDQESGTRQAFLFESGGSISAAADAIDHHFAGRTNIRWQDGRKSGTVRAFAEEETQLLYSDMPLLKAELERRGRVTVIPGQKSLVYSFPPLIKRPQA